MPCLFIVMSESTNKGLLGMMAEAPLSTAFCLFTTCSGAQTCKVKVSGEMQRLNLRYVIS